MASYSMVCELSPSEVIDHALAFFGRGSLDLEVSVRGDRCVRFADRGYVQVRVREAGNDTVVDLETHLWDDQVKEFMVNLTAAAAGIDGRDGPWEERVERGGRKWISRLE